MTVTVADSIEDVQEAVRTGDTGTRLLPVAGATKPALSSSGREDVTHLDVSGLRGIVEYDPAELTLTAMAATPVHEISAALAEHGQYLPCDPPLAGAGATLGGTVAAGVSGPGAFHHGGVRDFVIGVRFVDGTGRLITGGGKVVKNAAGFDLPKLMVGSVGRLGVMVQLSFKVFPSPPVTTTLDFSFENTEAALAGMLALARGPVQLEALDITPGGGLLARLGGRADTLSSRAARVTAAMDAAVTQLDGEPERALWRDAAELAWAADDATLVRVGLSVRHLVALDTALAATPGAQVHFSIGGTSAWIAWPAEAPLHHLERRLNELGLRGVVLSGPTPHPFLGAQTGGAFGHRIGGALDPNVRFLEV